MKEYEKKIDDLLHTVHTEVSEYMRMDILEKSVHSDFILCMSRS